MTETVKHTRGPWEACDRGDYFDDGIVILGDDLRVAVVNRDEDAPLIAASPEMLEALIMVRDADDDCKMDGLPSMPSFARAKIDAAIAKAEGRS